ncbi:guanylate kinase [bacterium]|jgi:guanylate kinase|nr:guanylate kinase [bacterium]MBP9090812.1 guanylate kinase [bacterium]MBP9809850.1 guanylate kinase [bacterium]
MNTGEPLTKLGHKAGGPNQRLKMGNLIVLTGPSGVGKGTLVDLVMSRVVGLVRSVSVTTRLPRPGEVEGQSYFFRDRATFDDMLARNEFMEWAEFAGNCYGTPKSWVNAQLKAGHDVLLELEVQGARQIHSQSPSAVLIFISPPNFNELEGRLRARATETAEIILVRLQKAKQELQEKNVFQYEVVNDKLEDAADNLAHIVYAERLRIRTPKG